MHENMHSVFVCIQCCCIIEGCCAIKHERTDLICLLSCFVILQAFDALLRKLQKYVPYESAVADLYAGAGVIGLSLATTRKCRQCLDDSKP